MLAGILIILACGYQYLLGKVSTTNFETQIIAKMRYQYLLGKVSTRLFSNHLAEAEGINIY